MLARRAFAIGVLLAASAASAQTVQLAVAANFQVTAQALASRFEARSGAPVGLSPGSSGKLYAQIVNGAPFDVFLSADAARPERLEREGLAVTGSRFTYAVGRLVLWSANPALAGRDCVAVLKSGAFQRLAVANPETAPYGKAALETLGALGILGQVQDRLAIGETVAQAMQFTASRSADLGFVALAQMQELDPAAASCRWDVPATLHGPLDQQAVLLKRAQNHRAAAEFLRFLKSDTARELIRAAGYDTRD